ncbi:hypothetical protein BCR32DRAFT_270161 [Anaeromyces robustus]|uniref:Ricin B lectin domain-containing protein n=1 Tax=Anaeromyces robustus TaxID=1754192 RepID=A0A1Y1WXN3_9FUNG|nr:hypothetical protein BCR32DRAFT_270161 [Anaeromyces robustus]|eukprot:ORX78317.1 hypothetical protein BCR32DRAFT_270161 [Anaeromyces robustus]
MNKNSLLLIVEQCLISNGSKPIIDDCDDTGRSKWEVPVSGDGFFKSLNKHLCLNVIDIDVGTVSMGNCDNNAILFDIDYSFNRNTINSPLDESKCLGYKGDKATTLSMVKCNKNKEDQQWKITTVNPNLCMRVADNDNSKLLMGECDENAILRYIKIDKTINAYCTYNECSEAFDDCRHPTKNDQYTYWKKCKAIIVNDFKKYFNDNYNIDDSLIGFNNISTTTTKKTTTTKSNSTPSPTPNDEVNIH